MTMQGQYCGTDEYEVRLAALLREAPLTQEETVQLVREGRATIGRLDLPAARGARAVGANTFLAIHHIRGLDPLTGEPIGLDVPPWQGGVVWPHLACALSLDAYAKRENVRQCATRFGMSHVTWHRAAHGHPVCVKNFFLLCAGLGRHPHRFTAPVNPGRVARETTTETSAAASAA